MHLPIAFNTEGDIDPKGSMERAFFMRSPGWATREDLSLQILAPEPAGNDK